MRPALIGRKTKRSGIHPHAMTPNGNTRHDGRVFQCVSPWSLVDHCQQFVQAVLGIAIEHARVLFVEQWVFDT